MAAVIGDKLIIQGLAGGRKLKGEIMVNGSKNGALLALAAVILFADEMTIDNLPEIEDVIRTRFLLEKLGLTSIKIDPRQYQFVTSKLNGSILDYETAKQMRASILLTGPLLARLGEVTFPFPGGCVIGTRPIDLFLDGFKKMGARVNEQKNLYIVKAPKGGLLGAEIFFKKQSVTATETFMLTAVLARGRTVLKNCALEPEIESLGRFLISAGASIKGLGTSTLEITGAGLLVGANKVYHVLPDRIEAGSFLILGALAADELTVSHCQPTHLEALLEYLQLMGARVSVQKEAVKISGRFRPKGLEVVTHEYPGFPTDLQSPLAVLLTQAAGESSIFETIFEGRLSYLETLALMGAEAKILNPHQAVIKGPTKLKGRAVESPDLRAGLAYIFAGIVARGQTIVHNVQYVDRGYERIDERLRRLGLEVTRANSSE